jgi:hypothetical protein
MGHLDPRTIAAVHDHARAHLVRLHAVATTCVAVYERAASMKRSRVAPNRGHADKSARAPSNRGTAMSTIDKQRNYGRQEARAPRLCVRQRRLDAPDQRRGPSSSDHGCAARPTGQARR